MEFLNNGPFYLLNKLIYIVNANGNAKFVYNMGVGISGLICCVIAILMCKKYEIKVWKAIVMQLVAYSLAYGMAIVVTYFETGMERFGGANMIRAYPFFPLLYWLLAKIFKEDPGKILDWELLPNALSKPFAHVFCVFTGCCYGYPCDWGVYNTRFETFLFPIQSLEVVLGLFVTLYAILLERKYNYRTGGSAFAKLMIIEGIVRVGCEFLRDDTKLFWQVSDMALIAVSMIIIGTVWLAIYNKKEYKRKVGV